MTWEGAGKGAATGAAVGSIVPGIGTIIGGIGGAIYGGLADENLGVDFDPFAEDARMNRAKNAVAPLDPTFLGGYYGGAQDLHKFGINRANDSGGDQNKFMGLATGLRGPQAYESQYLSDQEAGSRGYDQAGAMQLNREAAMGMDPSIGLLGSAAYGNEPSEAAYMMQRGLDQSIAQQSALAGGARGNAGIALAGGNQASQAAAMQGQAWNQAGQLRAEEMAQARGAYAGAMGQARGQYADLANTVRGQDQTRLQMGNQMGQFNAQNNDQYSMGMGNLANQAGNQGLGWYQASMGPLSTQAQLDSGYQATRSDNFNRGTDRAVGIAQANADTAGEINKDKWAAVGTGVQLAGSIYGGSRGG